MVVMTALVGFGFFLLGTMCIMHNDFRVFFLFWCVAGRKEGVFCGMRVWVGRAARLCVRTTCGRC